MFNVLIVLLTLALPVLFAQDLSIINLTQADFDEGDSKVAKWSLFLENLSNNESIRDSDLTGADNHDVTAWGLGHVQIGKDARISKAVSDSAKAKIKP